MNLFSKSLLPILFLAASCAVEPPSQEVSNFNVKGHPTTACNLYNGSDSKCTSEKVASYKTKEEASQAMREKNRDPRYLVWYDSSRDPQLQERPDAVTETYDDVQIVYVSGSTEKLDKVKNENCQQFTRSHQELFRFWN